MWYQLQIHSCCPDQVEQLSQALEQYGALAITLTDKNDDPVLEPQPGAMPLWPEVIINALYDDEQTADIALLQLSAQYNHLTFALNKFADQDWQRAYMDEFKPKRIGERLWIYPSWRTPLQTNTVNLILDPGLAFGTGAHPTTLLCLKWLDQATLTGKTMIDYGCGSGILGLAALKLGAAHAFAVDIDIQALQATQSNALINSISSEQLRIGKPDTLKEPVDLIMANILLHPLITLKDKFRAFLKDNAKLVVSGVFAEQIPELIATYQTHFSLTYTTTMEGWSLLVFKC